MLYNRSYLELRKMDKDQKPSDTECMHSLPSKELTRIKNNEVRKSC
jgi:hypothetical protein